MAWESELPSDGNNAVVLPDGVTQWFVPDEGVRLETLAVSNATAKRAEQLGGLVMRVDPLPVEQDTANDWIQVPVESIITALRFATKNQARWQSKKSESQYWQGVFDSTPVNAMAPLGPTVDFLVNQGIMYSRFPTGYFDRSEAN